VEDKVVPAHAIKV